MANIIGHGNTTSAGWVPEPNTRGTWSIYSTCLTTMTLCAWQAVHLNIPPPGEAAYKQTLRKVGWMILAVIAPEVVAANAWFQYKEAKELYDYVNSLDDKSRPKRKWYAQLGQMLFDIIADGPDRVRMFIWHRDARRDMQHMTS